MYVFHPAFLGACSRRIFRKAGQSYFRNQMCQSRKSMKTELYWKQGTGYWGDRRAAEKKGQKSDPEAAREVWVLSRWGSCHYPWLDTWAWTFWPYWRCHAANNGARRGMRGCLPEVIWLFSFSHLPISSQGLL